MYTMYTLYTMEPNYNAAVLNLACLDKNCCLGMLGNRWTKYIHCFVLLSRIKLSIFGIAG